MRSTILLLLFIAIFCSNGISQNQLVEAKIRIIHIDTTQELYNYVEISSTNKELDGFGLWYHKRLPQFSDLIKMKDKEITVYFRRAYPDQFISGSDTITLKGHAIMNPPFKENRELKFYQLVEIMK